MKYLTAALLTAICITAIAYEAPAAKPCARKSFQTSLIKSACDTGGQFEAMNTMSRFVASANDVTDDRISCNTCHSSVGGEFPLKAGALATFHSYRSKIATAAP